MKTSNNTLIWIQSGNEYVLSNSDKKELAKIKFNNFNKSQAVIESSDSLLELEKTGFPNPTTIHITKDKNKIASSVISTDGLLEFENGRKIQYLYLTGEFKFKMNGIGSQDLIIIKPVLDNKNSHFEIKVCSESVTDEELVIMSVLGFYLMAIQFNTSIKDSILLEVLGWLSLLVAAN